jgi:hypothetical protein
MFSDLRIPIDKNPLMPTQHDASSAVDGASVIIRFANLIHEIVGDTDVVGITEIILQTLYTFHERPNLILIEETC